MNASQLIASAPKRYVAGHFDLTFAEFEARISRGRTFVAVDGTPITNFDQAGKAMRRDGFIISWPGSEDK